MGESILTRIEVEMWSSNVQVAEEMWSSNVQVEEEMCLGI